MTWLLIVCSAGVSAEKKKSSSKRTEKSLIKQGEFGNLMNFLHTKKTKTRCLCNQWPLVDRLCGYIKRYSFLLWKLLSLPYLSLTRFSTLRGKICNGVATEYGDLLFIHSCQSGRSNGAYTFLMSHSNGSFTLAIDCCRALHRGSYKMEIEF